MKRGTVKQSEYKPSNRQLLRILGWGYWGLELEIGFISVILRVGWEGVIGVSREDVGRWFVDES